MAQTCFRHSLNRFLLVLVSLLLLCSCRPPATITFSFLVAADMRSYAGDNPDWFRGAVEAAKGLGTAAFMISPGDIDPPDVVASTVHNYLDPALPWYPVVGNHESETPSAMAWLRAYNPNGTALPATVRGGPAGATETCYSFEYANAHFAVINEYYDGVSDAATTAGDVNSALLSWLESDLSQNAKPVIFVIGHEPAVPQPDAENGVLRHVGESLDRNPSHRDAFWASLKTHGVIAYLCGHTHSYSVVDLAGIWQIDAGHARGLGDTSTRSTFIRFTIWDDNRASYDTYRLNTLTKHYQLTNSGWL